MNLSDRKKKILSAVIDENIASAEPVSSGQLQKDYLNDLSSATIRNELATLEEMGFLYQPHTSAGRVPTLEGIKFYIDEILNTLDGYIKFNIDNGELSQFAKLERFLQAGNILSQSILKLTLNSTLSAITKQNTGDFKTIEGTVKIKNSIANIQYINSQGSNMSLYITGTFNLLNQYASTKILGRIPNSIVSVMGNIGNFSLSQKVDEMDKDTKETINMLTASPIEKKFSTTISKNDFDKIPPLAYQIGDIPTREFIVLIEGIIKNNSSIQDFKWIIKE